MPRRCGLRNVATQLCEDALDMRDDDTRNGRQVHAENAVGFLSQSHSSGWRHDLAFFHRILGRRQCGGRVGFRFEAFHQPLHFFLTGGDPSLILAVQTDRLSQRKQVLLPVISHEAFRDSLMAGLNLPTISESCSLSSRSRVHVPPDSD
jgi:hypothetical protein